MLSFKVMKLKNITPKISDILLSYVTNSLSDFIKYFALGIAIELLIIANGIAFASAIFKSATIKIRSILKIRNIYSHWICLL